MPASSSSPYNRYHWLDALITLEDETLISGRNDHRAPTGLNRFGDGYIVEAASGKDSGNELRIATKEGSIDPLCWEFSEQEDKTGVLGFWSVGVKAATIKTEDRHKFSSRVLSTPITDTSTSGRAPVGRLHDLIAVRSADFTGSRSGTTTAGRTSGGSGGSSSSGGGGAVIGGKRVPSSLGSPVGGGAIIGGQGAPSSLGTSIGGGAFIAGAPVPVSIGAPVGSGATIGGQGPPGSLGLPVGGGVLTGGSQGSVQGSGPTTGFTITPRFFGQAEDIKPVAMLRMDYPKKVANSFGWLWTAQPEQVASRLGDLIYPTALADIGRTRFDPIGWTTLRADALFHGADNKIGPMRMTDHDFKVGCDRFLVTFQLKGEPEEEEEEEEDNKTNLRPFTLRNVAEIIVTQNGGNANNIVKGILNSKAGDKFRDDFNSRFQTTSLFSFDLNMLFSTFNSAYKDNGINVDTPLDTKDGFFRIQDMISRWSRVGQAGANFMSQFGKGTKSTNQISTSTINATAKKLAAIGNRIDSRAVTRAVINTLNATPGILNDSTVKVIVEELTQSGANIGESSLRKILQDIADSSSKTRGLEPFTDEEIRRFSGGVPDAWHRSYYGSDKAADPNSDKDSGCQVQDVDETPDKLRGHVKPATKSKLIGVAHIEGRELSTVPKKPVRPVTGTDLGLSSRFGSSGGGSGGGSSNRTDESIDIFSGGTLTNVPAGPDGFGFSKFDSDFVEGVGEVMGDPTFGMTETGESTGIFPGVFEEPDEGLQTGTETIEDTGIFAGTVKLASAFGERVFFDDRPNPISPTSRAIQSLSQNNSSLARQMLRAYWGSDSSGKIISHPTFPVVKKLATKTVIQGPGFIGGFGSITDPGGRFVFPKDPKSFNQNLVADGPDQSVLPIVLDQHMLGPVHKHLWFRAQASGSLTTMTLGADLDRIGALGNSLASRWNARHPFANADAIYPREHHVFIDPVDQHVLNSRRFRTLRFATMDGQATKGHHGNVGSSLLQMTYGKQNKGKDRFAEWGTSAPGLYISVDVDERHPNNREFIEFLGNGYERSTSKRTKNRLIRIERDKIMFRNTEIKEVLETDFANRPATVVSGDLEAEGTMYFGPLWVTDEGNLWVDSDGEPIYFG